MEHISNFTIHSFRGLRDLKIEKLGQINLLIGNNNSGKTSVLEATSIFCDPFEWSTWYNLDSEREQNTRLRSIVIDRLTWIFPQHINDNIKEYSVSSSVKISASGSFSIKEVTASYEKFTEIVITRRRL